MRNKRFAHFYHMTRYRRKVYLDYNATCPVSRQSYRHTATAMKKHSANISAAYSIAFRAREAVETARESIAEAVHAAPEEIVFTSGASESNNAILKGLSSIFSGKKNTIVASPVEHPSVRNTLYYLENKGNRIVYCDVDRFGFVDSDDLKAKIDDDCFLVCCMLANNETGSIQDISSIAEICRKKKVLLFSDCVQALGKIPVNLKDLGVDYASFSSHKIYGPKGCGAIFIKQGAPFLPLIHGGMQEDGKRAGTEATQNIIGFGVASKEIIIKNPMLTGKTNDLKNFFIKVLTGTRSDILINSPDENCLPNTLNLSIPGIESNELLAILDYYGIAVSAGSACSAMENKVSHVLTAIGLSETQARESIRISLGRNTSKKDILYTLKIFRLILEGEIPRVKMISAKDLLPEIISDPENLILDVRPSFLRRKMEGIPGASEGSIARLRSYIRTLPHDKDIYIICQKGNFSYIASYFLTRKGFKRVINVRDGLQGWHLSGKRAAG